MIHSLDTIDRVFLIIAILTGIMIVLQGLIRRAVWNGYLFPFFFSVGWLLAALLL